MVTVSFAANLRGRAGIAASLASANLASANPAPFVIPSEARNLLSADRAPEPNHAAVPAPPAARLKNSLRFMTPPFLLLRPPVQTWPHHDRGGHRAGIIPPPPIAAQGALTPPIRAKVLGPQQPDAVFTASIDRNVWSCPDRTRLY